MVKAAGGSASAHWIAVGPRAFNAPDVVLPAMERVKEKITASNERAQLLEENMLALQESASDIFESCGGDYGDLNAGDAKLLVSFVFKAKKLKGVGQQNANKQTAIDYLNGLDEGELETLLVGTYATMAPAAVTAEPLLELTDESVPRAPRFDADLPPLGMSAIAVPDWLSDALSTDSESAAEMIGLHILYHWPNNLGGWLHGKVLSVNKDKKQTVNGAMCNFVVFYSSDGETAHHLLSLERYAKNCKSPIDSWVLLKGSAITE